LAEAALMLDQIGMMANSQFAAVLVPFVMFVRTEELLDEYQD